MPVRLRLPSAPPPPPPQAPVPHPAPAPQDKTCDQALAAWALANGIALFFLPLAMVFCFAILLQIVPKNSTVVVVGLGLPAMCLLLFLLVWFVVGNVWVFSTNVDNCDEFLWQSCVAWLIVSYVIIALGLGIIVGLSVVHGASGGRRGPCCVREAGVGGQRRVLLVALPSLMCPWAGDKGGRKGGGGGCMGAGAEGGGGQ